MERRNARMRVTGWTVARRAGGGALHTVGEKEAENSQDGQGGHRNRSGTLVPVQGMSIVAALVLGPSPPPSRSR